MRQGRQLRAFVDIFEIIFEVYDGAWYSWGALDFKPEQQLIAVAKDRSIVLVRAKSTVVSPRPLILIVENFAETCPTRPS